MFYISEAMPFKEVHGARGAVFHLQIITKTTGQFSIYKSL
jgi:hypothetical protein